MRKFIWIILATFASVSLVIAQSTCPLLETSLTDALDVCADAEIGILCYGSGDLSLDSSAEDIMFNSPSTTALLADVLRLETQNTNDELAIAIMHLNREDVSLAMIAYGATSLENIAPRQTISVFALRGVNLRQEPSVDARVIGSLVQGTDYTAVGRLADNTWLRILLDDGRIGWASAQYFSTREGFTELDAMTPSTPPYLPMQALTLATENCGGLFIIAPEIEDEVIIFGINGAQIQINGLVHIQTIDDMLMITSLAGEAIVNTFGFEIALQSGELTSIPLNATNTIIGIATDAETSDARIVSDDMMDLLLDE